MGYDQVEVNKIATNLVGYHGDKRKDTAEIIIRRKHVGNASNDIGFKLGANGTYGAIISDYDSHRHGTEWLKQLSCKYAEHGIMLKAKQQGFRFAGKTTNNGKTQLSFVKA
jgi:hypothetical protein